MKLSGFFVCRARHFCRKSAAIVNKNQLRSGTKNRYEVFSEEQLRTSGLPYGCKMNCAFPHLVSSLGLIDALVYMRFPTTNKKNIGCGNWGIGKGEVKISGQEVAGSIVGFFGLGRIGLKTAKILKGFGPSKILYHNRSVNENAKEVDATYVDFNTLLEKSDFVIATCSVNSENIGIFNAKAFSKMKKSSVFVNVSRGSLVNQDDLATALTHSDILAAGIDVTTPEPLPKDHPLVSLANCFITPHIAWGTAKASQGMAEITARNTLAGLKGESLPSLYTD